MVTTQEYTLNFGPQHPAAHGVLRLILQCEGELVVRADPHIGLLHRATEKLMESKPYLHNIGYMDRLDYVSMMCNEHVYVRAIESLLGIDVPIRAQYIRTMFDEITRLLNHLLWLGAAGIDLGAMSMFLYCFREREDLMDMYEAVSGARLHATYYRPGGVIKDLPHHMPQFEASPWKTQQVVDELNQNRQGSLLDFIEDFTQRFPKCIDQYEALLTENRVWKQRTVGIGVVTPEQAKAWGFSGPMLRASGVAWDIRKVSPYAAYDQLSFEVPIGQSGDCYDRYMVRIEEMRQSNHLIQQCIAWLREHSGPVMSGDAKVSPPKRKDSKLGMEEMIHHYKLYTEGLMVPEGRVYSCIESPKGELGVYLVSDGANKPYRVKVRAPGFAHLSAFNELCQGHMIADIPAIISTLDVVFGEIDR